MIKIQKQSFELNKLINQVKKRSSRIGSIVTFVGYVRDYVNDNQDLQLTKLEIEHYKGMTEKNLKDIVQKAKIKWNIEDILLVHRVGELKINEPIVAIIVSSKHRDSAFDACRFIIDYLKTEAPFWKKEVSINQSFWVEQRESDLVKAK
jgi:molybdopterin synthase catalytic subunit